MCKWLLFISRYSYGYDAGSTVKSHMKYNVMPDPVFNQMGSGRGQLLPSGTEYDDVKRINNGEFSTGRSVGGPQYFVLDQEYVNSRRNVLS